MKEMVRDTEDKMRSSMNCIEVTKEEKEKQDRSNN